MAREHYALWYRLDEVDAFLLWYSDEGDGIELDASGRAPAFRSVEALDAFVARLGVSRSAEAPLLHDLDALAGWLAAPSPDGIDCSKLLTAWNLFLDLRSAVTGRNAVRELHGYNDLYDKLFFKNNLPSVTPPGKRYTPRWSASEVTRLASYLGTRLDDFRRRVELAP